jgi:hypothetical protein
VGFRFYGDSQIIQAGNCGVRRFVTEFVQLLPCLPQIADRLAQGRANLLGALHQRRIDGLFIIRQQVLRLVG